MTTALGPRRTIEDACCQHDWKEFHEDVAERKLEALDKITGVLDCAVRRARGENVPNIFSNNDFYSTSNKIFYGFVNNSRVLDHFVDYLHQKSGYGEDYQLSDEQRTQFEWNLANNLRRTMNSMKLGVEFLLPSEDVEQAQEFIEMLRAPSVERNYF